MSDVVLTLKELSKSYPGVKALKEFSLDFYRGEVHALVGENGAGKSTLIKLIAGAIKPDTGLIVIDNQAFEELNPHLAKDLGVEVIYQEFNLVESLSAAENICLGEKKAGLVDFKKMEVNALEIFRKFNVYIDPKMAVEELSSAQKQIVEIAKAISRNAKILIMDEPSAPLTVSEVACMFEIVKTLKKHGVTILYISHRLDEVFELADRVTVLRDGQLIETKAVRDTNRQDLIQLMVNRPLKETFPVKHNVYGDVALELDKVSGNGVFDISFKVRQGEILGLSGLVGAGRTELAQLIFGVEPLTHGTIKVKGQVARIKNPTIAISRGLGLIPEDRKTQGCILDMDIQWNVSLAHIRKLSKYTVVNESKVVQLARYYKDLLDIKTPGLEQLVKNLSGGNQQKVVLAKTLATNSEIIIFDEPTRGIDVGAKQEIYQLMCKLAQEGKAIIMISSDMEELLGMSDRIIVLSGGRVTAELAKDEFEQTKILEFASVNA